MKLYKYGSYDDYVKAQTEANKRKIKRVWAKDEVLDRIVPLVSDPKFILCHGTRNGGEMKMLLERYPNASIVGTEISETANQFEHTIQHDFHEVRDEWIGKCDIIYTNSFDHAYNPTKALTTWREQLAKDGILFIELPLGADNKSSRSDPLEIHDAEFRALIDKCNMYVIDQMPGRRGMAIKSDLYAIKRK